ncbi:MAG: ATP phosphoribosyltransferase [Candidatus Peribacteria bacterium]|jgi:ATP phosphoribosyltransferase|nr:ATP phosphoribosyltransferase [Candidatus Peribacteria bacterium]
MKKNGLPTVVLPKGRLYQGLYDLYQSKGINLPPPNTRQYYWEKYFDDCNLFIAKPKAVPGLLYSKLAEFGFCGQDIVKNTDYHCDLVSIYDTGLNKVRMVLASVLEEKDLFPLERPLIVATEFDVVAGRYLTDLGIPHYILPTGGSTEGYPQIGADIIIDIVETGETLKANGLEVRDLLFTTSTRLFSHKDVCESDYPFMLQQLFQS